MEYNVSIITTSNKYGMYIEKCILSVKNLKGNYIKEHLIIDNFSTDDTKLIVNKYPDIKFFQYSCTQAEAFNIGLHFSKGNIICWLNADDYYLPEYLNKFIPEIDNYGLLCGGFTFEQNKNQKIFAPGFQRYLSKDIITFGKIAGQLTFMMKKEIILDIGGINTKLKYVIDKDLLYKIATKSPVKYIPGNWAVFQKHDKNLSKLKYQEMKKEEEILNSKTIKKQYDFTNYYLLTKEKFKL